MKNKMFFFGYYEGFAEAGGTSQNVTVPANADTFQGVWRYVGTRRPVHSVNILQAVRPDGRPEDAVRRPLEDRRRLEREQLRPRRLEGGPHPEHGGLPLQPEPPQQPQLLRRPRGLRAEPEPPLRGDRQLLQGDRRPARPRFHQPARPLAYTESPVEALRGRVALAGDAATAERGAGGRQPRARPVRGHRDAQFRRSRLPDRPAIAAADAAGPGSSRSCRRAGTRTRTSSTTTRR